MLNFYKRIIFYCFLILLFFKSFAFAGWDDFAKGSDIDLLGKDITNVNQIYGNSTCTGFGGETTSHSLSDDGDVVFNKIEVNDQSFFDNQVTFWSANFIIYEHHARFKNDKLLYFGSDLDVSFGYETLGHDAFHIGILCGNTEYSGNINVVSKTYQTSDFGRPIQTNPVINIFSAEDPGVDNTQYLSLTHDQTDGVIDCGKGNVKVESTGFQLYSRTEAELKAITPTAAGAIYYDSTNYAIIVSTGTGAGAFGLITDGTSLPTGW